MITSIAVAGASGYAGGEVLRLLLEHPEVRAGRMRIGALTANANAGQRLGDSHPHLIPLADRVLAETTVETLAAHDVVFLGLPHGHSAKIAEQLPADTLVIDLGADFRLRSAADWQRYYGSEHAGYWPYGLAEYPGARQELSRTHRIAVPGCFPTGAILALTPVVRAELIASAITIVSVTGSSGAGKSAKVPMLHSEVHGSAKAYGVTTHRHTPEIAQSLQAVAANPVSISFTPVLAPMARGILTTAVAATTSSAEQLRNCLNDAYQDEAFVHVLPAGAQPMTANVLGSNCVQMSVEVDAEAGVAVFTAAIDNLTKGTAGNAIQSMNIALGLAETAGLPQVGIAP